MNVLALDLSSGVGTIAVVQDGQIHSAREFANDRKHSGAFFENLDDVMRASSRIEMIVVGIGPGSYAGMRIAIATAIGLQTATGANVVGVPSICALPAKDHTYCVIGDARRQSFYYAKIADGKFIVGPTLMTEDALRTRLADTPQEVYCTEALSTFPAAKLATPSAEALARLGLAAPIAETSSPLEPIYLRAPHITFPKTRVLDFSSPA